MTLAEQREKLIKAMARASYYKRSIGIALLGARVSLWEDLPEYERALELAIAADSFAAIAEQGYAVVPRDFCETPSETFEGTLNSPDYQIVIRAFVATHDLARSEPENR